MGGGIEVTSQPGTGTRFEIELPGVARVKDAISGSVVDHTSEARAVSQIPVTWPPHRLVVDHAMAPADLSGDRQPIAVQGNDPRPSAEGPPALESETLEAEILEAECFESELLEAGHLEAELFKEELWELLNGELDIQQMHHDCSLRR